MPRLSRFRPISFPTPHKPTAIGLLLILLLTLSSCARFASNPYGAGPFQSSPFMPRKSSNGGGTHPTTYSGGPVRALPKGGGRRVLGQPYWMFGRRYVPRRDPNYDRTGNATWVSMKLHGNRTANGELEDLTALVAAHPTLPLPSYAEVTNLANGCRLFLRLNDRGPFIPGRIIDMSPRAAKLLRFHHKGVTRVRLRYWGPAPQSGDDSFEQQYLRRYPDLGCRRPRRTRSGLTRSGGGYRGAPNREPYRGPTGVAYGDRR